MNDIIIIGAGVTGALIARSLARYNLSILVIEKNNDVGSVTSSANSAIIHSGYDPKPGSLKAKLNVKGCTMYPNLCKELDVPYGNCGTLTIVEHETQWGAYKELIKRSKLNNVVVKALTREETIKLEPNVNPNCLGALYAPSAGIVNPFMLVVNAMENAVDNGVKLNLNEEVISIDKTNIGYKITTNKNTYECKCIINAAGLYSDKVASMIEPISWSINPRKGQYIIFDKEVNGLVNRPLFPLPTEKGKGILVSVTTSGNVYIGPSSEPCESKDDYSTDSSTLQNIIESAKGLVPNLPLNKVIRVFSGVRATPSSHDFIIETSKKYNSFINVAGIESPGLASSPAIAEYVIDNFIRKIFNLEIKDDYNPYVRKHIKLMSLPNNEINKLIKSNPAYGKIVCQCEQITLGEIMDALTRSVPPHSIKGVKRRTRAGFGKCQGGYCMGRVIKILSEFYAINPCNILYDNDGSEPILKDNSND